MALQGMCLATTNAWVPNDPGSVARALGSRRLVVDPRKDRKETPT